MLKRRLIPKLLYTTLEDAPQESLLLWLLISTQTPPDWRSSLSSRTCEAQLVDEFIA